jgi:tetratricopeptide (TPR) repeat protein
VNTKNPSAGSTPTKAKILIDSFSAISPALGALALAISGYNSYIGYSSQKDITELKNTAESTQKFTNQLAVSTYELYSRAVERELTEQVAEMPGIELLDSKSAEIKQIIERTSETLTQLESSLKGDGAKLTTRHLLDGFLAVASKSCKTAISSLEKYDKDTPLKHHLLGVAHTQCSEYSKANIEFNREIELLPYSQTKRMKAKALNDIANNQIRGKQYDAAKISFQDALKADPSAAGIYYNIAALEAITGNPAQAIESLCEYGKRLSSSILQEVETDPDDAFKNVKSFLSKNGSWQEQFVKEMKACKP